MNAALLCGDGLSMVLTGPIPSDSLQSLSSNLTRDCRETCNNPSKLSRYTLREPLELLSTLKLLRPCPDCSYRESRLSGGVLQPVDRVTPQENSGAVQTSSCSLFWELSNPRILCQLLYRGNAPTQTALSRLLKGRPFLQLVVFLRGRIFS